MASKLDQARRSAATARAKAKRTRANIVQKAAMGGTAYGLGAGGDWIESNIPRLFGMPRTLTLAAIGYGVSLFMPDSSLFGAASEGVADGAAAVGLYQMGAGETVLGAADAEMAQLEQRLDDLQQLTAGADEDLMVDVPFVGEAEPADFDVMD